MATELGSGGRKIANRRGRRMSGEQRGQTDVWSLGNAGILDHISKDNGGTRIIVSKRQDTNKKMRKTTAIFSRS